MWFSGFCPFVHYEPPFWKNDGADTGSFRIYHCKCYSGIEVLILKILLMQKQTAMASWVPEPNLHGEGIIWVTVNVYFGVEFDFGEETFCQVSC